jgi:hypothetical protein
MTAKYTEEATTEAAGGTLAVAEAMSYDRL